MKAGGVRLRTWTPRNMEGMLPPPPGMGVTDQANRVALSVRFSQSESSASPTLPANHTRLGP